MAWDCPRRCACIAVILVAVGLMGCTGTGQSAPDDASASLPSHTSVRPDDATTNRSTQSEGGALEPSLMVHPSGTSIQLLDARAEDDRIAVVTDILNASGDRQVLTLDGEDGAEFAVGEFATADGQLELESGDEARVTVVFDGTGGEPAAELVLNPDGQDNDSAIRPRLVLVVPGVRAGSGLPARTSWSQPTQVAAETLTTSSMTTVTSSIAIDGVEVESTAEVRAAEIISDFDGREVDAGTILTVPSEVLFDVDESDLRSDARESLDEIVEVLAFYEDAPVRVTGHTDSNSSDEYNQSLSEDRAASVADYLTDAGIASGRLTTEGLGESQPRATNDTEQGRQLNRRVEILLEDVTPPE